MESLSDIVAQMRGRGEDGRMDRRLWLEYANRIEAAHERERGYGGTPSGLHCALVNLAEHVLEYLEKGLVVLPLPLEKTVREAFDSLSQPPRNVDLLDSWDDVWNEFCISYEESLNDHRPTWDIFSDWCESWLFAPVEEWAPYAANNPGGGGLWKLSRRRR